jgi:hypothetical protein
VSARIQVCISLRFCTLTAWDTYCVIFAHATILDDTTHAWPVISDVRLGVEYIDTQRCSVRELIKSRFTTFSAALFSLYPRNTCTHVTHAATRRGTFSGRLGFRLSLGN